jgi:hypothetical protein
MHQLDRAVDKAVHGKLTPQQALDQAAAETQAFLDKMLRRSEACP